jgi:hypothetical protein
MRTISKQKTNTLESVFLKEIAKSLCYAWHVKPIVLWFLLAFATPTWCQTAIKTGPDIGSRVPGFEAPDQNGARHSLESLQGPKGLMLVFFRSADW